MKERQASHLCNYMEYGTLHRYLLPQNDPQHRGDDTDLKVFVREDSAVQCVVNVGAARRINTADADISQVDAASELLLTRTLHASIQSSMLHHLYPCYRLYPPPLQTG